MEHTDWIYQGFDAAQARFLMVTAITHHQFSSRRHRQVHGATRQPFGINVPNGCREPAVGCLADVMLLIAAFPLARSAAREFSSVGGSDWPGPGARR